MIDNEFMTIIRAIDEIKESAVQYSKFSRSTGHVTMFTTRKYSASEFFFIDASSAVIRYFVVSKKLNDKTINTRASIRGGWYVKAAELKS